MVICKRGRSNPFATGVDCRVYRWRARTAMESTNGTGPRPAYISLLNAAALGETRASIYLTAWANVTVDEDLRRVLEFVARREQAHGEMFRRRLAEMGYEVQDRDDPAFEERLKRLGSPD